MLALAILREAALLAPLKESVKSLCVVAGEADILGERVDRAEVGYNVESIRTPPLSAEERCVTRSVSEDPWGYSFVFAAASSRRAGREWRLPRQ